jgi:hypothetical protein
MIIILLVITFIVYFFFFNNMSRKNYKEAVNSFRWFYPLKLATDQVTNGGTAFTDAQKELAQTNYLAYLSDKGFYMYEGDDKSANDIDNIRASDGTVIFNSTINTSSANIKAPYIDLNKKSISISIDNSTYKKISGVTGSSSVSMILTSSTGKKLATHVHLQHTTANFDWRQLARDIEADHDIE